ncbi:MAG TPA: serine/threonine-protein kinase, partial [Vicinamibacteria bacterium]|nr:serine/threonine-protein kinase [Vicinamibacteria bacterium]
MSADALHNLCRADPVWAERYEGWTVLGHGGSATVVRTHGKALGEDLALKVFPHLSRDEWTRFRQEVSTAQKLTSPFIVRTYSPFPRGSFAWIELELIEGGTLRHELDGPATGGGRFPLEQVLEVGAAVAAALATAHEAGVTHRDVKPANILLPRGGRPAAKLGDFGISRLAGAARLTSTGLLVGTPQFAAPEVAAGALAEPPADVYSFALCLYLMLSGGRPPFAIEDEGSPSHWLRAHTEERPRPITDHDPAVPRALAALLERALDKDPGARPSAEEALS